MIKLAYIICGLLLIASLTIIICPFDLSKNQVDNILKIVPAFFAASALMVTLSLYDKFGLKKFIYEKKLKTVLDILEELKGQNIYMQAYHEYLDHILTNKIEIGLNESYESLFNMIGQSVAERIVLVDDESVAIIEKFNQLFNSPYFPFHEKKVPKFKAYQFSKVAFNKDLHVLFSYGERRNILDLNEGYKFSKLSNYNHSKITLKQYVSIHKVALLEIKTWIKKETNLTDIRY